MSQRRQRIKVRSRVVDLPTRTPSELLGASDLIPDLNVGTARRDGIMYDRYPRLSFRTFFLEDCT